MSNIFYELRNDEYYDWEATSASTHREELELELWELESNSYTMLDKLLSYKKIKELKYQLKNYERLFPEELV